MLSMISFTPRFSSTSVFGYTFDMQFLVCASAAHNVYFPSLTPNCVRSNTVTTLVPYKMSLSPLTFNSQLSCFYPKILSNVFSINIESLLVQFQYFLPKGMATSHDSMFYNDGNTVLISHHYSVLRFKTFLPQTLHY